jgi:hypothetical protein
MEEHDSTEQRSNWLQEFWERVLYEDPFYQVGPLLGFGIFILPIIFVWFLLRDGHSLRSRVIGFCWLAFCAGIFAS